MAKEVSATGGDVGSLSLCLLRSAPETWQVSPGLQSFGAHLHVLMSYSPCSPSVATGKGANSQQQLLRPGHSRCAVSENSAQLSCTQKNLPLIQGQTPGEDGLVWTTLKQEAGLSEHA